MDADADNRRSLMGALISWCLNNRLMVILILSLVVVAGVSFAPFDWQVPWLPRRPVPVDAIPDIGENQQIVFTSWPGRSPQDVEDQITDPLTASLLGIPNVKTIRGLSMFGFSTIYVIFNEHVDFYWGRSRILEKLNSLPSGTLPDDVRPGLGPDATALGQVFWYTLEGQDQDGTATGGWDLGELRSIQDWYVKNKLVAAEGVSEVASVGGFVEEYQVDVDPDAMRAYDVKLAEIFSAVRAANAEVGARSIEVNRVEYLIRGIGFVKSVEDLENTVIKVNNNVPIFIHNVAHVLVGPGLRRGALDKEGNEAVGGVVIVRFGANPLDAIKNVKERIAEVEPSLPAKVLIDFEQISRSDVEDFAAQHEFAAFTRGHINNDGWVRWLRSTSSEKWPSWARLTQVKIVPFYDRTGLIHETLDTLSTALLHEILVTIIVVLVMVMHLRSSLLISGLLPVAVLMTFIAMKLFGVDANVVALSGIAIAIGTMVDMGIVVTENILKHSDSDGSVSFSNVFRATSEVGGAVFTAAATTIVGFLPVFFMTGAGGKLFRPLAFTKTFALVSSLIVALVFLPLFAHLLLSWRRRSSARTQRSGMRSTIIVVLCVLIMLARHWVPLGPEKGMVRNLLFVAGLIGGLLAAFYAFHRAYERILSWCLQHKLLFLLVPGLLLICGGLIWSGLGKEFMPPLDEGSFLYMPSASPHASIGEMLDIIEKQDKAISDIPEVLTVVGKLGRVDSALDPAPLPMIETVVTYKPEYITDEDGQKVRQWREHIRTPDNIWDEILKVAHMPGITKPEKLQPISTRLVMLQSGIRGSMAVKLKGLHRREIGQTSAQIERLLRKGEVEGVDPAVVNIDRSTGDWKPYLEIVPDRKAIARYGIKVQDVQHTIEVAIGGRKVTTTVDGRQRFAIRVRYMRELRDDIESLGRILVPAQDGVQIPLVQLADIRYVPGPQVIKTEDTSLVGYVFFGKKDGYAEVDVVDSVRRYLEEREAVGELMRPSGVTISFAGTYENQVRAQQTLAWVLPLAMLIIFMILYLQFHSVPTTALVFFGIAVAWAGGFMMIWLYGQSWFLNFSVFGVSMRGLFQVHPINLSVAVWVGFLALFGIATDDGVVMATYLDQSFTARMPRTIADVREATMGAATRRVRPCLMTTATTILALIPVLTSTGRGSDVMVPMAIPCFGGMLIELITMFVVPVLYSAVQESKLKRGGPPCN